MDDLALRMAKAEVQRFMERVKAYEQHAKDARAHGHYACPERAAIARSSMDVTRALARLRGR